MKFRINTGPATPLSGGSGVVLSKPPTFVPPADDDEELSLSPVRFWRPNQEPDTPLACGCSIPWPIIVLLAKGRPVQCDLHGWQPVAEKSRQQARRDMKKCKTQAPSNQSSFPLTDTPPF